MKKSELKKIIQEVIKTTLNEYTIDKFYVPYYEKNERVNKSFFAKLMPKTARTADDAHMRLFKYVGDTMFVHVTYYEVQPHGNMPNKPTYGLHCRGYWMHNKDINVNELVIYQKVDNGKDKKLGMIWVDAKQFRDELKQVFEIKKFES